MNPDRNLGMANLRLTGSKSQDSPLGITFLVSEFEERGEDSFRKAPDHVVSQMIGREKPVLAPDSDPSLPVYPFPSQIGQRHPKNQRNLVVGLQPWSSVASEDERSYDDRPGHGCLGRHIIQNAEQPGGIKIERELFTSFPNSSGQQVRVFGLESAARQSHVPRPGISHPLGALDEKYCIGIGRQYNGNAGQ
jgi:hypothetical protein